MEILWTANDIWNLILPNTGDYIIQVLTCIQENSWIFFIFYNCGEHILQNFLDL